MTEANREYWMSPGERRDRQRFLETAAAEFVETPLTSSAGVARREFLTAAGFAFGALALAGCGRAPERLALPMVDQAPEMTPGRSLNYASTCSACSAGCGLLVTCRDGRPIKLEGNPSHGVSRGGLCAVGQASILGLYDRQRLLAPKKNQRESSWREVDAEIRTELDLIRQQRGTVRVLSNTVVSPTTLEQIRRFLTDLRTAGCDARHVIYDAVSSSAILTAHQETFGVRVLPHYRFDRAEMIVSVDADFLGTWISPVEFTRDYQAGRSLVGNPPRCSRHVQFEATMSLTGAKADERYRLMPSEYGLLLSHLAKALTRRANVEWAAGQPESLSIPTEQLESLVDALWEKRGRSLVICGLNDVEVQKLCNFINHLLGNYGTTLELELPSLQRQGNDSDLRQLVDDLHNNRIAALFLLDCNPAFDLPNEHEISNALQRVRLSVSGTERLDESAALMKYVCPHPHALASWSDAEPITGKVSVAQPTFVPLGNTRSILESLATWGGSPRSARQMVQDHWREHFFPRQTEARNFQFFWDKAVHDGYVSLAPPPRGVPPTFNRATVRSVPRVDRPADGSFTLVLHPSTRLLEGRHAYNPWLQELPDPITKISWDNYLSISPAAGVSLGLTEGDMVRVESEGGSVELPVVLQPGQHDRVVSAALGYGSRLSERFATIGPQWLEARPTVNGDGRVGKNVAPLVVLGQTTLEYVRTVRLAPTGGRHLLACTQTHHSIQVPAHLAPRGHARRSMIQETAISELQPRAEERIPLPNLWPADHPITGPRWGMVIDLAACTGCSACVIACQVENNIPVVGKDEVYRQREMHWIRIDRYYADEGKPAGEVDVAFQPMLCQHCGNAPCETVCPVIATAHSSEGLNQQVYNRCVGTRYCANNCPYKVRRFNWFDYAHEDAVENLVLNPDVTVRSRGVMEKCSFCVQRIQEAKLEARRLGVPLADSDVKTACQQSCPAQAILFGDLNDANSSVSRLARSGRAYQVLRELNVEPAIHYLKVARNRVARAEGGHHG